MTSEIAAALAALKAASDIAKALMGLHDSAIINAKVIELQGEIMSAQQSTLAAQEAQSTLAERERNLEKEVADLKAWGTEREKYKLKDLRSGVFAYALKEEAGAAEPAHLLCSNCYQDWRKSILQKEGRGIVDGAVEMLVCLRCGSEINMSGSSYGSTTQTKPSCRKTMQ